MDLTHLDIKQANDVIQLFYDTFEASENESEAKIVSALVKKYLQNYPKEDLKGYVALDKEQILGSVFFSRLYFPQSKLNVFLLSPMAVKTECQGRGIAQKLIRFAHSELIRENVNLAITYGDVSFYSKVGYQHISESNIAAPHKLTYPEGWLVHQLDGKTQMKVIGIPRCITELNDPALW